MFGDDKLEKFDEWMTNLPRPMFPKDYLWYDKKHGGFVWWYVYNETMNIPDDFDIIDFPGGLYAVATDIDGKGDEAARNAIREFIARSGCFEEDRSREMMGNIISPPTVGEALGYNQMDYYTPILVK